MVLWGPTPYKVFGYMSDVNVVAANHNCIFREKNWAIQCARETHECMESITPELVYSEIKSRRLI